MENFVTGNMHFDFAPKSFMLEQAKSRRNGSITTWNNYDPDWLVELARQQQPELDWLPAAFARATRFCPESRAYIHFVDPSNPNKPGSEWQFETNIRLESQEFGTIIVDVLTGQRIGGIEFLNRQK